MPISQADLDGEIERIKLGLTGRVLDKILLDEMGDEVFQITILSQVFEGLALCGSIYHLQRISQVFSANAI